MSGGGALLHSGLAPYASRRHGREPGLAPSNELLILTIARASAIQLSRLALPARLWRNKLPLEDLAYRAVLSRGTDGITQSGAERTATDRSTQPLVHRQQA